jgi:predicted nucleotidyltransferase
MIMNLNQDFREFLAFLNSNEVEYLVLGGYAVAAHGHPRYTKDIDVWVHPTAENSKRVMAALTEFGFGSIGLTEDAFVAPDTVVQLGYPPRRIDLLTEPSGVDFQECYPRRFEVVIDGTNVPFIGLEDLKINKRASGRPRDLADIDDLS